MKAARRFLPGLLYFAMMAVLWRFFHHSRLAAELGGGFSREFAALTLLAMPLWFFGLGRWESLLGCPSWVKICSAGLLSLPYFVARAGSADFRWPTALLLAAFPVLMAALLGLSPLPPQMTWRDGLVLGVISLSYYTNLFAGAWPGELRFFTKLFLADTVLFCFLVVRRIERAGYSLLPTTSALVVGIREWVFFLPFGLAVGELTGFVHFHPASVAPLKLVVDLGLTVLIVAIPEELFFRGVLENLLETRIGSTWALILSALLFGLAHVNHGPGFNWRYMLLATIAGIFYGRAWRAQRQIFASIVTHSAVDVVWALWFR